MKEGILELWESLGLDASAHLRAAEVFLQYCSHVFENTKSGLEGMKIFYDFTRDIHGDRIVELNEARKRGTRIIGALSQYVPEEIALACGAIQVGLGAGVKIETGLDREFPGYLCPLVESLLAFREARLCAYMASTDMLVGDTVCDGRKLAFHRLGHFRPAHIIDTPKLKSGYDRMRLRQEYERYLQRVEELTGNKATPDSLMSAIRVINERRKALVRLNTLRWRKPCPISGLDALLVFQLCCFEDAVKFTESVNALCDEMEAKVKNANSDTESKVRLLVTGSPILIPNWKPYYIIENSNAVVIGENVFTGVDMHHGPLVDESRTSVSDMLDALVDAKLINKQNYFSPLEERLEHLVALARNSGADGIIHYGLNGCLYYDFDRCSYKERMKNERIPMYQMRTDYTAEDYEDIKIGIDTFVQMIR